MRKRQQFRAAAAVRRRRPTGGSEASRGRGSRGQGPAQRRRAADQVGRWGRTFSEMLHCCAASFHPVGTVGRRAPRSHRTELSNFSAFLCQLRAILPRLNILMLQPLQKLQQTCPASLMMKGTLLRTCYSGRTRKTMWTMSPQKTSLLLSVLLQGPRTL